MLTGEWRKGLLKGVVEGRTADRGSGGRDC